MTHLDLCEFAPLRHLLDVQVWDTRLLAEQITGSFPEGLAVEAVRLRAAHFDLAGLARTPTIWSITLCQRSLKFDPVRIGGFSTPDQFSGSGDTLAGNTTEVSVQPLLDLPALAKLDLADAQVTDIETLATAPRLGTLTLNAEQWQLLRAAGADPRMHAAVALGGQPTLAQAIDWTNWATTLHHTVERHVIRGSLHG